MEDEKVIWAVGYPEVVEDVAEFVIAVVLIDGGVKGTEVEGVNTRRWLGGERALAGIIIIDEFDGTECAVDGEDWDDAAERESSSGP